MGECLILLPLLGQKGANKRRRGRKGEKEEEEEGDGRGSFINLTGDERTGELLDERTQKKSEPQILSLESFVLPNYIYFTPFFSWVEKPPF